MKQGLALNQIYCQDCLEGLRQIADETIPLAIVDPPFGPFCTYDTRCTYETWLVEKKREVGKASDSLVSETKGAEEELPETAVEEVGEGEETGDASVEDALAEDASAEDVSAEDVDALENEDVDSEEPVRSEGESVGRRLSGRKATAAYLRWAKELLAEVHRVLTPDGTLWLAMDDAFAAEFKRLACVVYKIQINVFYQKREHGRNCFRFKFFCKLFFAQEFCFAAQAGKCMHFCNQKSFSKVCF